MAGHRIPLRTPWKCPDCAFHNGSLLNCDAAKARGMLPNCGTCDRKKGIGVYFAKVSAPAPKEKKTWSKISASRIRMKYKCGKCGKASYRGYDDLGNCDFMCDHGCMAAELNFVQMECKR